MRYSAPGFITSNGLPLLQAENIDFKADPKNKPVETLLLGYAGHSAGAFTVSGNVSNAVPAPATEGGQGNGPEVDWVEVAAAQNEVRLAFHIAGKVYDCAVQISESGYGTGVDNANKLTFQFMGRLVAIL